MVTDDGQLHTSTVMTVTLDYRSLRHETRWPPREVIATPRRVVGWRVVSPSTADMARHLASVMSSRNLYKWSSLGNYPCGFVEPSIKLEIARGNSSTSSLCGLSSCNLYRSSQVEFITQDWVNHTASFLDFVDDEFSLYIYNATSSLPRLYTISYWK